VILLQKVMSYIEKKYLDNIKGIFDQLTEFDKKVLGLINQKSIKHGDEVAKICADVNKKINTILGKYYPEIKDMNDKLEIKASLKFYYDLIDKLTHFIRSIENFQKLDDKYYKNLIKFIEEKNVLISSKYRAICTQELTAFYDPKSRDALESILTQKISRKDRHFFTMGPLEEEIKKIAKIAGAHSVKIKSAEQFKDEAFMNALSVIMFTVLPEDDEEKLNKIGKELQEYIESKKHFVKVKKGMIMTDAKLLPDKD